LVPETGRWDDLIACIDTPCEDEAIAFWAGAIAENNGLACKWAPREKKNKIVFSKLRKSLKMSPKEFRKFVSERTNVVEKAMCSGNWEQIDYNTVPSVAMARSANAFLKHDAARYDEWRTSLSEEGTTNKVNASTLFPHDVYLTSQRDPKLANAQFDALPNYMEGNDLRIMPICDFSGSMNCSVTGGTIRAYDVSMSLGLYCSDRVGKENPFYRKFIPFSTTSVLVDWEDMTFTQAARSCGNHYVGSTNVKAALDQILSSAKMFNATNDQIPNCLLIISDMQFDKGGTDHADETTINMCMREWEANGYNRPKIVYWNTRGKKGSPDTQTREDVALVSGYSPSILGSILGCPDDFSPMAVLDNAIEKYEIVIPEGVMV
jgi:hypothetical protein